MTAAAVDGPGSEAVAVERLWLDRLDAIGRPVAHELRNALNGVAVNLEVVRGRAARADAPASSVARFADAAAEQLDALAQLTDALLGLVRRGAAPASLSGALAQLVTLLGAVARPDGGSLSLDVTPDGAAVVTALPPDAQRALLAGLLLGALERGAALTCELDGASPPTLRVVRTDGGTLPPPPADVAALAAQLAVRLDADPAAWRAVFPPAPAA